MEKLNDSNATALIQAMEKVLQDFNVQFNAQLDDNFKRLNQSMERIQVSQEQYLRQTTAAVARLTAIGETLDAQSHEVGQTLEALTQLVATASGSLPEIQKQITELTDQLARGVRSTLDEAAKDVRETIESLQRTAGSYILDAESRSL